MIPRTTGRLACTIGLVSLMLLPGAAQPPAPPDAAPAAAQPPGPPNQPARPPSQGPSFRAGVDVVSLSVTVTDPAARYVTDLDIDAFSIFEDGVKQEISYFNRTNLPVALSLLLDTSASMEDKMSTVQDAAIGFAKRLRKQDLAQVVDFDSRAEIVQDFTNEPPAVEKAIRQTSAGGSTSLYNALYISLKELKRIKARTTDDVRRQAIIVLSDGEDTSSIMSFEDVLDLAKRSETAIYTIGIRGREVHSSKGFKEAEFVLRQLAQETGGRSFFPGNVDELSGIYGQISDELSSQYTIGYSSKNAKRDGAWRRIVVRVSRANAQARTKLGYFAPAARGTSSQVLK